MNDFISLESKRAEMFKLLSVFLCEPEEEVLINGELFTSFERLFNQLTASEEAIADKLAAESKKHTITELKVEYTRLFIGPFITLASPYSSLYFGEKTLMGDTTVRVRKFYEEAGLEFDKSVNETPDHAVIETEFLYYLIHNEIEALQNKDNKLAKELNAKQSEFLKTHYLLWIPKMCGLVVENTKIEYFKILFNYFISYLEKDYVPELKFDTYNELPRSKADEVSK
ncbi:MAG: molecular chaperone TorD family protein [Chlorobi bacterium]|nr:molecular chaperone TorD family protein [Chlorobiota bacterium]